MHAKRLALITGANQGVGFQVAKELAANGLAVLVGSRDLARGEAAAKEIGAGAVALQLDVTDGASIAAAAERIRKEFGRLDLLIQNAAISNTGLRPGTSVEAYAKSTRPSVVSLDELRTELSRYPGDAELVWVQEEPSNQGAWPRMALKLPEILGRPLSVVALPASSAPAAGSAKVHAASHRGLIETAIPAES